MTELREVFEMVTKQVEPDQNTWKEQERRQRRTSRNRRIGGYMVAAAVALIAGVLVLVLRNDNQPAPAHRGPRATVSALSVPYREVIGLDGTVQREVTGLPQDAQSLNLSPDGRTIAFVTTSQGRQQIGTIGLDGQGLGILTDMPSDAKTPAWSPDGSRVAFVSQDQIFVINADGSRLTKLTSDGGVDQWPSWSPDGSTIAYSNLGSTPPGDDGFSVSEEIWTVPSSGGTPTRLTHNSVADDMPSYSPDGTRIALFRDDAIWLMDANGRNAAPMSSQWKNQASFNPRWSPDGSLIMFTTYFPSPGRNLFGGAVLNIHTVEQTYGTLSTIPGNVLGTENAPSWLPSGDALLVNRYPVA